MADKRVTRAKDIVRYALYSDPLLEDVEVVRLILKNNLTKEERSIMIGVAGGIPVKWYQKFYSTWVYAILNRAAYKILEAIEEEYGIPKED